MKKKFFLETLIIGLLACIEVGAQNFTQDPSFHIDYKSVDGFTGPTKDKPQSKLWYMDSKWWAILPNSDGYPSLWERSNEGWTNHREVEDNLRNVPGQADVWYENNVATAIGVSDSALVVFQVKPDEASDKLWKSKILAHLTLPNYEMPNIETATIVKDNSGNWWVAADVGEKSIYVWSSKDAILWTSSMLIADGIAPDDISSLAVLKNSVAILWSNQTGDYYFDSREHHNNTPIDNWSVIHRVASGNRTADDHINSALSPDGTLWVTTKNEVDSIGFPNLILRVRKPSGIWENYSYANNEENTWPSRPAVFATPDPSLILAGHTIYNKRQANKGEIVFGIVDTSSSEILTKKEVVIKPKALGPKDRINDITGPKQPFPYRGPWIILASDNKGNVYEADLRPFLDKK